MKNIKLASLLLAAGLAACGGVAVEDPTGSGGSVAAEAPSAGSGASPSGTGTSNPLPTHALGDCTPGFPRAQNSSKLCNWLTKDGICFDDKDAACNCICPTNGNSVCFSAFGGPGSATLVQCL